MIEGDIEERMAGFAPSQRTGPSDLARDIMSQQVAGPSMEPTVPEPSPLAREIMSRDNDVLMSSLMGAVDVNPDEAAKASRIGSQFGVGQDIALRNMPEMEHREKMMQLRQMQLQQRDPILAEFMSDQAFARMAYDDLPNLSVIGRSFRFMRDIPTGISEGFTKAVSQAEMSKILERQRERGGYIEEYEKAALRSYQQELSELSKETGLAEAGAYLVSQQLTDWRIEDVERVVTGGVIGGGAGFVGGPLAPATVPAGIALGLKAGFATTMFERSRRMETASLYGELEPELGHDMANKIAFGAGILNASLDVGSLGLITAPLRAPLKAAFGQSVKEAVRKRTVRDSFARFGLWYAGSVAAETGTETLQEMNNVLAMELGLYLQDKPLVLSTEEGRAEVADRLATVAVETALGMVTVGLPGPAVQFYSDVRGAARAMNEHKKLENITKAVSESKLLPRNSAALESYIASTAEDSDASTVFIDAATANDILRQSGLTDVELDAALPGVRQQIETLQEKDIPLGGSDITIPMEQFTVRIAKTPLQEQLKQHARLSAGAPSFLEAQRIRAEMPQIRAEAEQILAMKQEADAAFVAEAQQVEDEAFEQVRAVGQFTDIEARTIAKVRQAMVVVDAAEAGMTPAQYQRERGVPLVIRGEGMAAPMAQAAQITLADVERSFAEIGVEQRLTETDTTIRPGIIRVPADLRGEGRATRAMQSLIAYADQAGKRIDISPTGEFGANKKRLVAWYKRLGFVENKGSNKDFAISATMYRLPSAPMLRRAATLDADYLAAVERGDMEAAQRMVNDAAETSMPNSKVRTVDFKYGEPDSTGRQPFIETLGKLVVKYHGGKAGAVEFTKVLERESAYKDEGKINLHNQGIWLANNPGKLGESAEMMSWADAAAYANNYLPDAEIYSLFANITNPKRLALDEADQYTVQQLKEQGYDGAYTIDTGAWVAFSPEQVKRADAVVRDEQGNIVPLSRRFDITSPKLFEQAAVGPARGGFDPRTLNVLVGKGGDVSTLSHELIHLRIAEYLRMARSATPPARVMDDLDTLFVFMGVEGATPQERLDNYETMTIDQRKPLEEKVTYNFEIYLYEGKAPSVELRGVFDRLAAWMRRVYKSIRDDLNAIYRREFGTDLPILTPEVRSVFDRMLASEEQIKRQEAISGMKGLFQTQAESGMGDAEWAAYQAMQQEATDAAVTDLNTASMRQLQWLGNARARILRDLQKKHEAKRKEVTAEMAATVKVEPVYRAMTYLRYGRFVDTDGAEVEVEGTHRLDIEKVRAMYASMPSAESVEPIRATGMAVPANVRPDITPLGTGKYGMLGRDGLDPDVVADMFGYSSGDEMVRALLAAKPMKEAVVERTDAEMLRRFGDMNTPAALEAEVQKALHNESRARFVAVELRHIAKATQSVRVMLEAAKQVATDMISDMTVREVRPGEFVSAEARAARDAERIQRTYGITEPAPELAQRYGTDRQQALIRAKRAQLYQNQLAAEALRVKEYVDKQVKYLRRVLRDENVKRMGADATDQVRSILDNYSLVSMTRAQREQVTDLRNWLAAEEANGMMVDIDPSLADSARRRNYTELTVAQFRDLVDSVKLIEYRGKNERNIYLAGQKLIFEEMRDGVVASMTEVAEKKGRKVRKELGDEDRKWMNSIASYDASQQTIGNIVYVLDGGKRDGPLARALLMPANDAGNQEATDRAAVSEKVNDIVGPLAKKGQFVAPKMYFPNINESLSLEQRMVVALNYGNQSNIDRLLNGEQWTEEQARVIIESLTEEQLQAVQAIWDVMSSFRDRVAEKSRRLTGKEPRWLEPLPMRVTSADGKIVELRGGYYPAKYNPRRSVGARELDIAGDAERLQREAYTATTTSRSFEKNRSDRPPVDQVLSRQFVAMYSGLNEVIHDLAWHDFAISATRLLRDKSFQRVVKERYGLETYNAIKDWVDVVVAGDRTKYDSFEQVAIFARQNVSVAAMGIRLLTAAVQPTGIFPAMTRTGVGPMVRAIAEFAYSPVETSRNVVSRSSFMENRNRTRFRDLNEIQNIVQEQSRLQGIRRTYISSAYVLTSFMQGLVDTSVWMAAYSNAIKEGKSERDAVFVADQTVIDTQGSGRVQDLSSAMRGGKKQSAYAKLFTPFYQYSNTMYSLFGAQMRTAPSYGKAAKDAFLILTVGAIVEELIRYALRPSPEDEEPEDLIKKLAANQIDFVVGLPFGIREFRGAGSLIVGTEDGVQSYRGPSGLRIVTDATQAAVQARQGEFDAAFRRSMINLLGTTVGIPSAQINSTIDGIEAVSEGEVEGPSAVLAPLTGVKR